MPRQDANDAFLKTSFLYGGNASYIEDLHARFKKDPGSVDQEWRDFFASLEDSADDVIAEARGPKWRRDDWPVAANGELVAAMVSHWAPLEREVGERIRAKAHDKGAQVSEQGVLQATRDSVRALMMIRAYRIRGHLQADLDPLHLTPVGEHPELDPESYGFTQADFDRPIFLDHVLGLEFGTLREILDILKRTYCSTMGVEFMHVTDPAEKAWIQERIEGPDKGIAFTDEGKKAILAKLIEAEGFEKFLDVKYTGTKRFGLDGGESIVPALEQIIKRGGHLGVEEIVIGMSHRGRLNVLAQVMAKPHRAIWTAMRPREIVEPGQGVSGRNWAVIEPPPPTSRTAVGPTSECGKPG